jgi:hypothetical protein
MSENRAKTPVHLWIVAIIALLWTGMGAFDYLMTQTKNEAYLSQFTKEQMDYFTSFPVWVVAAWATAVWGGVLASVLLLLRNKMATVAYLVSFVAMLVTTVHNFILSDGLEVMGGPGDIVFTVAIFLVALGLVFYARALQARGVLT